MNYKEVLKIACDHLLGLRGQVMDVVDIDKPPNIEYAQHLAKILSKLSPLVGNMIEFNVCFELNKLDWKGQGMWMRQDPGFPDTIFDSDLDPLPGIEIKTWFPLATEITARFKDSITFFDRDHTNIALVTWVPEFILYGKPKIIDVWTGSAKSVALARDRHYHSPPDYLVIEPEDTSNRTANLQQTNTNGYKFQGDAKELRKAELHVASWGEEGKFYDPNSEYQDKVKELLGKYRYRLDTNFAKIDRIEHREIERFKSEILDKKIHGHNIKTWAKLVGNRRQDTLYLIKELI